MTLPEFDKPPVIETVLGVEFKSLDKWRVTDFGLFWQGIQADYPHIEVQPPLPSQLERLGLSEPLMAAMRVVMTSEPLVRCWFIDESRSRLIQLQNDRFIHNWRKVGEAQYPRYASTRPRFAQEWARFSQYLESRGMGAPAVRQCEVTYINHLERGIGWESFDDLSKVVNCWSPRKTDGFLPCPEGAVLAPTYLLPDGRGRLRIQLEPAIRNEDKKQIIQLTITARGKPKSSSTDDILQWLDFGREWVVRGFADFTTPEMHAHWIRRE